MSEKDPVEALALLLQAFCFRLDTLSQLPARVAMERNMYAALGDYDEDIYNLLQQAEVRAALLERHIAPKDLADALNATLNCVRAQEPIRDNAAVIYSAREAFKGKRKK
jgi:hypothetical protein